jgi:hypothetical protein
MAQQTAVDFLVQDFKKLTEHLWCDTTTAILIAATVKKAQKMEKEQMANFANEYADAVMGGCMKRAEQYYNETFNQ